MISDDRRHHPAPGVVCDRSRIAAGRHFCGMLQARRRGDRKGNAIFTFTIGDFHRLSQREKRRVRTTRCRVYRRRGDGNLSASAKRLSPPPVPAKKFSSHTASAGSATPRDGPPVRTSPSGPSQALLEEQRLARAAASRIWHRHRRYLYGLSLRWLRGDPVEAEDAVADVVYKASVTIGSGRHDIVNERAWLTRVLHNRCMDIHRRRYGIQPLETAPDGSDDNIVSDTDADRSAEELLLNKELGEIIRQALAELPDALRGPVTMRLINGEPYTSISEMFSISEANARKRIQQAREILRQRLETYLHGDGGHLTVQRSVTARKGPVTTPGKL